jgi:hypothetical protein
MRCRPLAAIQESQTYKKRRRMKKLVISEQWTREIHESQSPASPSSTPWGLFIGRGEVAVFIISIGVVKNYIQVLVIYTRGPRTIQLSP